MISPTSWRRRTQIFQFPGHVVIHNEMIHETRVIPLDPFDKLRVDGERSRTVDGRPHLNANIRQWMGDSRGHWEGDTLVVESTNFNAKVGLTLNGNSTPISPNMRIVERLTRVDADTITYEATIHDPDAWTRPWSVSLPLKQHSEYGMYEYACHEGNYGMRNILSGARAEEQK